MNRREKQQITENSSHSLDSSSKRRNVENVISEIRFLRNRLSEMSPSAISPGISRSQPSSLKLSSQKEDNIFSKLNESQNITDKIKSQLQQSQIDFSFQLEQAQEEQKRKGDIDRGYNQVADDLKSVSSLLVEVREKENKLKEKERELLEKDNRIKEKEKEIAEKDIRIKESQQITIKMEKEILNLKTELADTTAQLSTLRDQFQKLESNSGAHEKELQDKLQKLEIDYAKQMQDKVQKLETTSSKYAKQLAESSDMVKHLTAQLQDQHIELQVCQEEIYLFEKEVETLQEKHSAVVRESLHFERTAETHSKEKQSSSTRTLLQTSNGESLADLVHMIQQKLDLLHAYKEMDDKRQTENEETETQLSNHEVNYLLQEIEKRDWEIDKLKSSIRK